MCNDTKAASMAMSVSLAGGSSVARSTRTAVQLTALTLIVDTDEPQKKNAAGKTEEAVDEHPDGDAHHLGRQLSDHLDAWRAKKRSIVSLRRERPSIVR